MSEPNWVSRKEVEEIHETMIDIGGGAHGLRDPALLESALARPQNLHAYGENDHFQLTASYAEGIARNHAFVDGNKRTAFATADVFLAKNGHNLDQAKGHEHTEMMEQLGQGQISREDAADHFREHSRSLQHSLHAPEVECIAKGKADKPYEFGCKVSITTTNAPNPPAASSCSTPRPSMDAPMTAIPWEPSSSRPRR